MSISSHKILLVGASGVGKSTACIRLSTGEFMRNHNPSPPNQFWRFTFHLKNMGGEIFTENVLVLERTSTNLLSDEELKSLDGAIFMSDRKHYVSTWAEYENFPNIPRIFVLTKADIPAEAGNTLPHLRVSYKSNYNFELPWLSLFRCIHNDATIVMTCSDELPAGADFCE